MPYTRFIYTSLSWLYALLLFVIIGAVIRGSQIKTNALQAIEINSASASQAINKKKEDKERNNFFAERDQFLADQQALYSPLKNYMAIDKITDLNLLNNTEKYLKIVMGVDPLTFRNQLDLIQCRIKQLTEPGQEPSNNIQTKVEGIKISQGEDQKLDHFKKGNALDVVVKNIRTLLLADDDAKKMGRNLIESMPEGFYLDECTLLYVDNLVGVTHGYPSQLLLLSTADIEPFIRDKLAPPTEARKKIADKYINETLPMFSAVAFADKRYISNDKKVRLITAYSFINSLVIEHFSSDHESSFLDITKLSLDEAIKRISSFDSTAQKQDRFIYFLMNHKKFDTDNHNFPKCKGIFIKKFNHFIEK